MFGIWYILSYTHTHIYARVKRWRSSSHSWAYTLLLVGINCTWHSMANADGIICINALFYIMLENVASRATSSPSCITCRRKQRGRITFWASSVSASHSPNNNKGIWLEYRREQNMLFGIKVHVIKSWTPIAICLFGVYSCTVCVCVR